MNEAEELAHLTAPSSDPKQRMIDYWGRRAEKAEAKVERMEAAIRWALGEQPDPQGVWFVPPEVENKVPRRYWWRSHLRGLSGIDEPKP